MSASGVSPAGSARRTARAMRPGLKRNRAASWSATSAASNVRAEAVPATAPRVRPARVRGTSLSPAPAGRRRPAPRHAVARSRASAGRRRSANPCQSTRQSIVPAASGTARRSSSGASCQLASRRAARSRSAIWSADTSATSNFQPSVPTMPRAAVVRPAPGRPARINGRANPGGRADAAQAAKPSRTPVANTNRSSRSGAGAKHRNPAGSASGGASPDSRSTRSRGTSSDQPGAGPSPSISSSPSRTAGRS